MTLTSKETLASNRRKWQYTTVLQTMTLTSKETLASNRRKWQHTTVLQTTTLACKIVRQFASATYQILSLHVCHI